MSSISVAKHRKKTNSHELVFFQRNKSRTGFVKCTLCVKYASRVKCAAARVRDLFHFTLRPTGAIFHNFQQEIISHSAIAEYFT